MRTSHEDGMQAAWRVRDIVEEAALARHQTPVLAPSQRATE
jgi:hypothetical protein